MENKPKFCSECGAKLTGSATFCPECGAKQQAAPVPAPAPAPAEAPENTLAAPKTKLNVFGLILTLAAMGATVLGIMLLVIQWSVMMGRDFSNIGIPMLRQNSFGMLTAFVAPLVSFVMVLTKNKKLAKIGLIVAAASLAMQCLMAAAYPILNNAGVSTARLGFLLRPVNGESLFSDMWRLLRTGANTGKQTVMILLSLSSALFYFLKNILAAVGCLLAAAKKKGN